MIVDLLRGLAVSVEIFLCTLAVSLPLGIVIALGRMSKNPLVSGFFRVYISVVRGTPLMLQIMFVYFAPYMLFGLPLSNYPRFLATVIAFGLNYAAYFAEIYRGGILSIDRGQTEAAVALGMPKGMCFLRIILPQVVKRVISPAVQFADLHGQGHVAGVHDRRRRDVHDCEAALVRQHDDGSADRRRRLLLCLQLHCRLDDGAHREAPVIL